MSANHTHKATVEFITPRGEGAFKLEKTRLHAPYVLPEEEIEFELQGTPASATNIKVIKPNPDRIGAPCTHFGTCGGCLLQHWRAEPYRNWKRDLIVRALKAVGLETTVHPVRDAHGEGRRRAIFHARRDKMGKWNVGFAKFKSHDVVPLQECLVLHPSLRQALPVVRALANPLSNFSHGVDLQVTATDAGLDVDIRGLGDGARNVASDLARLAEKLDLARLSIHGEPIALRRSVLMRVGSVRLELPPASFLQATRMGEEVLSALTMDYLGQAAWVVDLYAGVGPFTLRLLAKTKVHAVEGNHKAIEALSKTVHLQSGLKTFTSEVRDLVKRPLLPDELARYDAIVFDPPRAGAMEQVRMIAASGVSTVVAVSCNPESFAKDARTLVDAGYTLKQITPVDQFLHSAHIELVAQFTRTKTAPQKIAPRGLRIERMTKNGSSLKPSQKPNRQNRYEKPSRDNRRGSAHDQLPQQNEPQATEFIKIGGMRIAIPPKPTQTDERPTRPQRPQKPNGGRPKGGKPLGGKPRQGR